MNEILKENKDTHIIRELVEYHCSNEVEWKYLQQLGLSQGYMHEYNLWDYDTEDGSIYFITDENENINKNWWFGGTLSCNNITPPLDNHKNLITEKIEVEDIMNNKVEVIKCPTESTSNNRVEEVINCSANSISNNKTPILNYPSIWDNSYVLDMGVFSHIDECKILLDNYRNYKATRNLICERDMIDYLNKELADLYILLDKKFRDTSFIQEEILLSRINKFKEKSDNE